MTPAGTTRGRPGRKPRRALGRPPPGNHRYPRRRPAGRVPDRLKGGFGMMWYGDDVTGWGYAVMAISMVVFWGLVIAGIVVLVRYVTRTQEPRDGRPADGPPSAEQVLAERFARGEIDEEEYRSRLATLRAAGSTVARP